MQFSETVQHGPLGGSSEPQTRRFVGPSFAQVQVAPKRRAFLVRQGDVESLRLVMACASTIWGGMRSIIMPVLDDGTVGGLWIQAAEVMQVVEIVDFTCDEAGNSAWTQRPVKASWPVVPAPAIEDGRYWHAHPIVSFTSESLQKLAFEFPAERTLRAMAAVGDVVLDEERTLWADAGVSLFTIESDEALVLAQLHGRSVLAATANHDHETVTVAPFADTLGLIWIMSDPDDFLEAFWFWNCRAIRPHTFKPSISIVGDANTLLLPNVGDAIIERIIGTSLTEPDLTVISFGNTEAELDEFIAAMGVDPFLGPKFKDHIIGESRGVRRLTASKMVNVTQHWLCQRSIGPQTEVPVALQQPAFELRARSPMPWNEQRQGSGHVVLRISTPEIVGPQKRSVAALYHQHASWEQGQLRVISYPMQEYNFTIGLPSHAEILQAACGESSATYALNDKGQQVRGVLNVGIDPQIFRSRDAIAVIRALTTEPDRDLRKNLAELRGLDKIGTADVQKLLVSCA